MKDNDLHYRIHLSPWRAPKMAQQLSHDVNWLCSVGIMDYSLLVGVHRSAFYCNSAKDQVTALNKEVRAPMRTVSQPGGRAILTPAPLQTGERDAAQLERLRAQECHSESPGGARRAGRGGGRRGARMSASVSGGLQRWAAGGADAPGSGTPFRGGDGGVPAEVVEGPSIYYMGLIDILQEWTWTKRLERYFKSTCLCLDKDGARRRNGGGVAVGEGRISPRSLGARARHRPLCGGPGLVRASLP